MGQSDALEKALTPGLAAAAYGVVNPGAPEFRTAGSLLPKDNRVVTHFVGGSPGSGEHRTCAFSRFPRSVIIHTLVLLKSQVLIKSILGIPKNSFRQVSASVDNSEYTEWFCQQSEPH